MLTQGAHLAVFVLQMNSSGSIRSQCAGPLSQTANKIKQKLCLARPLIKKKQKLCVAPRCSSQVPIEGAKPREAEHLTCARVFVHYESYRKVMAVTGASLPPAVGPNCNRVSGPFGFQAGL